MAIEFQCNSCKQTLRISDEYSGKLVKCPTCGNQQIASSSSDIINPVGYPPLQQASPNPFEAPRNLPSQTFGSAVNGSIVNYIPEIGNVIRHAFEVWKKNFVFLLAPTLILAGIYLVAFVINLIFDFIQGQEPSLGIVFIHLMVSLVVSFVQIFFQIGYIRILLGLLRNEPVNVGMLIGGGDVFLPVLGISLLVGFATVAGLMFCLIPGIIFALFFWPTYYLVLDKKCKVLESFDLARTITKGNIGNSFLLMVATSAITFAGLLLCLVGVIPLASLAALCFVTGYLSMSGQLRV